MKKVSSIYWAAFSAWFREYRKPNPTKQPTAESVLAIIEFLDERK
jgi:hypothetical protein